jgi:PAS domain S-box-containing protein
MNNDLKKNSVAELIEKEQILSKAIIDSIPGAFYILDEKGMYVLWNSFQRDQIAGKSEEEMLTTNAIDTIHPDDREFISSKIASVLTSGKDEDVEARVLMRGGPEFKWLLMTGRRIMMKGKPFLTGIGIDVSARKKIEEDLKKINELYNSVTIAVNDGIWDWNTQTGNAFFSPSYYIMLGYEDKEFVANYPTWKGLVHPDDISRVEQVLQESINSGSKFKINLRMKMKSGDWLWVATCGKAVEDDVDGKTKRMVGTLTDITNQKNTEAKLDESELRFRTIFENSADAIMTLEPPLWKFTSGNKSTLKMFEAKDEAEFCSAEPWRYSPEKQPDGRPSAEKAKEMIETAMWEGSKSFEWTHKRLTGEDFPADVLLTKINYVGNSFLQATIRDISAIKNAELIAQKENEKIEKMNELMVGRELKMMDLKKEIQALNEQNNKRDSSSNKED